MATPLKLNSIIFLTFPVWGTALGVWLITSLKNEGLTKLIISLGIVLIAFSSAPIVNSKSLTTGAKVAWTLAYFFASAFIVFGFGLFLLCRNQCS